MTYFPSIHLNRISRSYGYINNGDTGSYTTANIKYDDINNAWKIMSNVVGTAATGRSGGEYNGYGYAVGGLGNGGTPNSKYDSNTDTWSIKTVITTAVYGATPVLSLERFMYVMGGIGGTTSNQQYDDVVNTWSAKTAINSRIYLYGFTIGGFVFNCLGSNAGELATTDRYDDIANTITSRASANTARYLGSSSHLNSFGYTVQGRQAVAQALQTTEKYDEINNTWTAKTNTNNGVQQNYGWEQNNYMYTVGGYAVTYKTYNEKYDDIANTWTNKTALLTATSDMSAFSVGNINQTSNVQNEGFIEAMRRIDRERIPVDITASRAIDGTAYTNNESYNIYVTVSARCIIDTAADVANIQAFSDTNADPVAAASGIVGIEGGLAGEDVSVELSFIVRPTHKYKVVKTISAGCSATLGKWFETPLK